MIVPRPRCRRKSTILNTQIRDRYFPSSHGVGCLGEQVSRKDYDLLYQTWNGMLARCYDEKHNGYENYGAKGIFVDSRWLIFSNFVEDVKNRHIVYQKDTIYEGSVAFSNNEKYFTYMDDDGDEDDESLVHVDLQTGSKRVLAQNIRSAFRPMKETYFSNDDRFLLLSSRDGNTVKVYDFSKNSFSYQRVDAYLSGHIEHITSDSKYLVSLRTVFDQGSTKIAYNEIEVFDLANAITINKTKYPATVSHITRDESYYFKHDSLVLSKDELTIYSLRDASDEGIDEENKNRQINIHSIDLKSFTDIKIAEVSSHMDDLDCYDFSGVCGIKYSSINALIKNKSEEQNLTSLASVVLASGVTFSLDLNGVRNVYNYELSPDSRYFYTTNKSGMLWLFKILD